MEIFEKTIKERIFQGEYSIGSPLKSERIYAAEFGISSNKVHRVLQKLVKEGYLSSKRGSGYYVNGELECKQENIRVAYIFPDNFSNRANELLRLRAPRENIWIDTILCNGTAEDYSRAVDEVLDNKHHDILLIHPNQQLYWFDALNRVLAQHFPLIFHDYQEVPNVFPLVGSNHFEFGFLAAKVISENNYRKALYLGYDENQNYATRMRWLGFTTGCKHYNLAFDSLKVKLGEIKDQINSRLDDWMDHCLNAIPAERSALFASTGSFTFYAIRALAGHGIRPPEKLGFLAADFPKVTGQEFTSSCLAGNPEHTTKQIIELIKTTVAGRTLTDNKCINITPVYLKGDSL